MEVMTKEDRDELRDMIGDILGIQAEKTEGKFNVINEKLDAITEQTTRTNGRVTKLENQVFQIQINELNHTKACPQNKRLEKLETESLSQSAVKKFLIGSLAIIVSLASIITFVYEIFIKQ
jgi:predicted nuclease with TOPRIM domain